MSKLRIIETQIDNYNETNNQFIKYETGLNIILGKNEAGKSTLMNFIKNIFIRKSDAKGYLKYDYDNNEQNLRAEKNKQKENDKTLEKINPLSYKTGFIIDLDDIMFAKKADAEALVNIVKDSSGNAINIKQDEYYNYIYGKKQKFALTGRNIASKTFQEQFNHLKELDMKIKELQSKEEEYNNICSQIEYIKQELETLNNDLNYRELILNKNNTQSELEKIKINKKLLDNKEDFEKIRENYGALNSQKQKLPNIEQQISDLQKIYDEKLNELNKIQVFSSNEIENFELSSEILNEIKNYINENNKLSNEKQNISSLHKEIEKRINDLECEAKSIERQLNSFEIKDSTKYKNDKDMLESYKNNYSDWMNKAINNNAINTQNNNWYNKVFMLLFGGLFFASLSGLIRFWNSTAMLVFIAIILVSCSGMLTVWMKNYEFKKHNENNGYKKYLDENAKKIIELCNKYNFKLNKDDNFIVQINAFIQKMNDNLSEYKIIENDLLKTRITLEKEKENFTDKQEFLNKQDKNLEKLNEKKLEFIEKTNIQNLEKYPEIYEKIKELKTIQQELSEKQNEIKNIEINTETFVEVLNKFIETSEINNIQTLNKYDYEIFEKTLSEIRNLLDESISGEKVISELENKIEKYNEELTKFSQQKEDIDVDENSIQNLKNEIQIKHDEKTRLIQTKENLEQVSSIVNLKNQKNIELNNLKIGLNKLIQKEIIFEIIKKSKEKFNETQPNLICAKQYLSEITNGKYSEIDFENKTISGKNVGEKDWDCLSRGTKEQLYLALRLGFATNFSKDIAGNPNGLPEMPLIIDDAFVNFDKERTIAILKCLSDFSKNHQVLYFTCHNETIKDILKKSNIEHHIIEL